MFLADSVEYLGHRIDAKGLHTTSGKLEAICEAPTPQNVTQLQFFSATPELQWQVHSQFGHPVTPSQQSLATRCALEMVRWVCQSIQMC